MFFESFEKYKEKLEESISKIIDEAIQNQNSHDSEVSEAEDQVKQKWKEVRVLEYSDLTASRDLFFNINFKIFDLWELGLLAPSYLWILLLLLLLLLL